MDPTTRILLIGQDVTGALTTEEIPFDNDLTKKFGPDLQLNTGSFSALLNVIQRAINSDTNLHLVKKFNWKSIKPDPKLGSFLEYYLQQSVNALILAIDGIISHSPYS